MVFSHKELLQMAARHFKYRETQGVMPKKMLWLVVILMIVIMGLFGGIYISQEFLGREVGENSIPTGWALVIFIVTALLIYYISRLKIVTRVNEQQLIMYLGVIGKRKFPLDSIEQINDYDGSPAVGFLGYGYRIGIKQIGYIGRAEQAIELILKNEKRALVITTNRAQELKDALKPSGV